MAEVYRETHTGTELWERPELTRLRQTMARREVDALICFDPDRFSRKQVHTALLQGICEQAGVELRFAEFDFTRDATGQFLLNARVFAAELEREKIIERTQRGRVAKLRSGKLAGNTPPPYGYRFADETKAAYAVDDTTVLIVRRIFALAAGGMTLRGIGALLAREGVPSPTGLDFWAHTTIRTILKNRAYIGEARGRQWSVTRRNGKQVCTRRPDEEQIVLPAGVCPPIVDPATFETVQARLTRNKAEATRNCKDPEGYLLRGGYVRDAATGRSMVAYANDKGTRQYRHRVLRPLPGDREHVIGATTLDREVWDFVTLILRDPSIIEGEIAGMGNEEPAGTDLTAIDQALAAVAKQQANVARLATLADDEDAGAPLLTQLKALAERKRTLEAEREAALARRENWRAVRERFDFLAAWGRHMAERAKTMPYNERRDWMAALGLVVAVKPSDQTPRWVVSLGIPLPDGTEHRITFDSSARRIVDMSTSTRVWASRSTRRGSASGGWAKPARSSSGSSPSTPSTSTGATTSSGRRAAIRSRCSGRGRPSSSAAAASS